MKLIDIVKGNSTFQKYHDGSLWYQTDTGVLFPVPIADIGTATFHAMENSLLMMRYIRKHLKMLEDAKKDG